VENIKETGRKKKDRHDTRKVKRWVEKRNWRKYER
jgi:hypothetical protein